jgi:hypothetical protein
VEVPFAQSCGWTRSESSHVFDESFTRVYLLSVGTLPERGFSPSSIRAGICLVVEEFQGRARYLISWHVPVVLFCALALARSS